MKSCLQGRLHVREGIFDEWLESALLIVKAPEWTSKKASHRSLQVTSSEAHGGPKSLTAILNVPLGLSLPPSLASSVLQKLMLCIY